MTDERNEQDPTPEEALKAEEPKAEAEEPKTEEAKAEEAKAEAEEPKAEEAKAEAESEAESESEAEAPKGPLISIKPKGQPEPKAEAEEPKAEEPKAEEPKVEEPKVEEPKTDPVAAADGHGGFHGHHIPEGEEPHWLDHPEHVKKILIVFWSLCGVLIAVDLLQFTPLYSKEDAHFEPEWIPGFYGFYGFLACVVLVLLAKQLRKVVMRPEDYYDG